MGKGMTTIAYRDGILAADGRINVDGMISTDNKNKIIELDSTVLFNPFSKSLDIASDSLVCIATAGCSDCIGFYLDYLYLGHAFNDLEGTAIVFTKKYIYRSDGSRFYEVPDEPIVLGSGSTYALTAMRMGASAEEAVKIACEMDVYSGGKITTRKVR